MSKKILYLSFDVETDGPTPTINNLLSIGIVGIEENTEQKVFEFEANLLPIEGHIPDSQCMKTFWLKSEQQKAWEYLHTNQKNYIEVFEDLSNKLTNLANNYKIIWIAYPSCFDWMFLKSYYELAKLNSKSNVNFYDIGYECVCISTLWDFYKNHNNLTSKEATKLFKKLGEFDNETNHYAISDAEAQGKFYIELMKILKN